MYDVKDFIDGMVNRDFYPFLCVPCSNFKGLIKYICNIYPQYYYPVNNEGEAVAIAIGLWLRGKKPVIMIQNSGIGNMLDPITSLQYVYEIPLIFITSWRGYPGIRDEKQHIEMGKITKEIYSLVDIPCIDLTSSQNISIENIIQSIVKENNLFNSINILINKNTFCGADNEEKERDDCSLTTSEALKIVLNFLNGTEKIVSSTGYLSRELYYQNNSENNFYMVGSMGCAISIGLGLALNSNEKIIVLDGDGASLMRLEGMVSVGSYKCDGLLHIIFENDIYESTGGQENLARSVDFNLVAKGCGYKKTFVCENEKDLVDTLNISKKNVGPQLIVIKVGKNKEIKNRPTFNYLEIRDSFGRKKEVHFDNI